MIIDIEYLRLIDSIRTDELLRQPQFLDAQDKLFSTIERLRGKVDFDIADMRETHILAALRPSLKDKRVLDVGCGSPDPYVLEDTFRDRYPPLLAELLQTEGAQVTGIDIRTNEQATYTHLVRDLAMPAWTDGLKPFDMVTCISLFNAPEAPFVHDLALCDTLMRHMRALLKPDGLMILTLPEQLKLEEASAEQRMQISGQYLRLFNLQPAHIGKGMVWASAR